MIKISAVYQIVNNITGDRYVGSSKNVKRRWARHKCPSSWNERPNSLLYKDFQKYGVENFSIQILAPVEPKHLKQVEQEFIELLNPTYNSMNAKGYDAERAKETDRKYNQSEKHKEAVRKATKKYLHQICSFRGETLTLGALASRFLRAGIEHPVLEAKKYLQQICSYNGETLTLCALASRFLRDGVERPVLEAKKYLVSLE